LERELLISAGPGEWRAALIEDGVPVELFVERGDRSEAGSIHLGRVRRLVPALGAALVDIGGERPAFLPRNETVPRGRPLHEGERLIVQIRREAQGGKAARVTERLRSTPAIAPHSPIKSRTGVQPNTRDLAAEQMARHWQDLHDSAARLDPPARLEPVETFAAALAAMLPKRPSRILVDEPGAVPDIMATFANSAVEHLSEPEWPTTLDEVFAEALSETLALSGAGSIHFESTKAGTFIDVDSGTPETGSMERVGLSTNLAAAAAIARQARLRNIGGAIIVDFVGLDSRVSREKVRATLAEALRADPAEPQILGWTRLGHLELVRPRRGRPLAEALLERRPGGALGKSALTVAHEVLRTLRREARAQPGRQWRLRVAPDVERELTGRAVAAVQYAEQRFARGVVIEADASCERERFQISLV
jgi:ribonuclease G